MRFFIHNSSGPAALSRIIGLVALCGLALAPLAGAEPVSGPVALGRGDLHLQIEVDDAAKIQRFGPRFDRTGWVRSVRFRGTEMVGPGGFPDEFGIKGDGVLGYEEATEGGGFIKLGVGRLARVSGEKPYFFSDRYPILQSYPVRVLSRSEEALVLEQDGRDEALPWSYRYRKSYELASADTLVIRYELENTGERAFSFNHYNHNWFQLAGGRVGPQHRLETGFVVPPPETPSPFVFERHALQPRAEVQGGGAFYYESELPEAKTEENHLRLTAGTAYSVRMSGDFAPERIAVYAQHSFFCPEVFFRAVLRPGETARWSLSYQFTHEAAGE